jgi:SAM-dependent methyltransferase
VKRAARKAKVPSPTSENRALWDAQAQEYERKHARGLAAHGGEAWGFWRIPEKTLHLLPEVRGRDVLELGCGAARFSRALAARGARAVGLDLSRGQLTEAVAMAKRGSPRLPLVQASAERLPFLDSVFDLVFCDWGALTFADPLPAVPEAARVLRPGGTLVFSTSSPFRVVCEDRMDDRLDATLRYPYFGLHRIVYPATPSRAHVEVNHVLTYGGWIALFGACGLTVRRLVQPSPVRGEESSYLSTEATAWAKQWPLEDIWVVTKDPVPARGASRVRVGRGPK